MLPEDRLAQITQRFEFLEAQLNAGAAPDQIAAISREYAELKPVVTQIAEWRDAQDAIHEAQAMLGEIVGAFPKDAPRAMFQKAEYFRLDGEKASAIACYRRILSNPEWGRSGEASRATPRPSKFPVFAASPPTGRRRSCS